MKYKLIDPSHPHIRALIREREELDIPQTLKRNLTFHPVDKNWPLYSISVWTPEPKGNRPAGFFISTSVKTKANEYWEDCGLMTALSIPFELLPELIKLLDEVRSTVAQ
jgi:hypothetical protein